MVPLLSRGKGTRQAGWLSWPCRHPQRMRPSLGNPQRVGTSSAPLMLGMSDAGRTTNRGPLWGERSSERLTTIKKDFKKKHLNGPQRRGMQTFSVKQPLFDRCDTRVAGAQIWARLHPLQLAPPTDSPTCTFPSSSIKTRLTHLSFSFCNLHHQTFRFFLTCPFVGFLVVMRKPLVSFCEACASRLRVCKYVCMYVCMYVYSIRLHALFPTHGRI